METRKKSFSEILEEFVVATIRFDRAEREEEREREENGSYQYCHSHEYEHAEKRKKESAKELDEYVYKL